MNIFVLDQDPTIAARYHCDAHVVKMCLETTQLFCTVAHLQEKNTEGLYRPTHKNHPCVHWLLCSSLNRSWVAQLGHELFAQYEARYNKVHKSKPVFESALASLGIVNPEWSPWPMFFCNCTPYKEQTSVVSAYRRYYVTDKRSIAKWERGVAAPSWWLRKTS